MRLPLDFNSDWSKYLTYPEWNIPSTSSESSESSDELQYQPWTATEERLRIEEYCSFHIVMSVFRLLKRIPFSSNLLRYQCLGLLRLIHRQRLVAKQKRFPARGVFVNVTNGMYASLMKKIIATLDCQHSSENQRQQVACNCSDIFALRVDCALNIYRTVPTEELYHYGVFKRETFERWHALTWE